MLPHGTQGKVETTSYGADRYTWVSDAPGPGGLSFRLPSPFCASALCYPVARQLLTQVAILSSSLLVSKTPGKSWLGSVVRLQPINSDQAREKNVRHVADHSNHKGWNWGKGKKFFPKDG